MNTYNFGEEVNQNHLLNLIELINYNESHKFSLSDIKTIRIAKLIYNTKGFEIVKSDGSTELFSYTKKINSPKNNFTKFREACRQAIQDDLIKLKQNYFKINAKNGKVKCQETGELLKYDDLCIDHRQPNTFSIIVDRFIEINNIDLSKTEYLTIEGGPDEFKNVELKDSFIIYHKKKSNLRIVSKHQNSKRTFQARIKRQKKDLEIY